MEQALLDVHGLQAYDELNTHANSRFKTDINKRTLVRRGPRPLARAGLCADNQVDHQLAADDSGVAPPTATMASVAVLPVVNLGANAADMHASDGLSDELIGTLGLVPGLLVNARTSVFAPRDRSLGVRDVTTLDPHQDLGWQQLGYAHLLRGENMHAVAALRCASALSGARLSAHLAYALVVSGDSVQARRITGQLERTAGTPEALVVRLAIAYAGLGDRDRAFALLERRYALRASFMIGLAMEPALRSLHGDPRWHALLRRMRLKEPAQQQRDTVLTSVHRLRTHNAQTTRVDGKRDRLDAWLSTPEAFPPTEELKVRLRDPLAEQQCESRSTRKHRSWRFCGKPMLACPWLGCCVRTGSVARRFISAKRSKDITFRCV